MSGKGNFRHFMLKEIFEQPRAVDAVLEDQVGKATSVSDSIRRRTVFFSAC